MAKLSGSSIGKTMHYRPSFRRRLALAPAPAIAEAKREIKNILRMEGSSAKAWNTMSLREKVDMVADLSAANLLPKFDEHLFNAYVDRGGPVSSAGEILDDETYNVVWHGEVVALAKQISF